jgi:hypothetical protein
MWTESIESHAKQAKTLEIAREIVLTTSGRHTSYDAP